MSQHTVALSSSHSYCNSWTLAITVEDNKIVARTWQHKGQPAQLDPMAEACTLYLMMGMGPSYLAQIPSIFSVCNIYKMLHEIPFPGSLHRLVKAEYCPCMCECGQHPCQVAVGLTLQPECKDIFEVLQILAPQKFPVHQEKAWYFYVPEASNLYADLLVKPVKLHLGTCQGLTAEVELQEGIEYYSYGWASD